MKKMMISILVAAMLLISPAVALGETYTSEEVGITFEVPEGMAVDEFRFSDSEYGLYLRDENVYIWVDVRVFEELKGIDLATADEAQIEYVLKVFWGPDVYEEIAREQPFFFEVHTDDDGTRLIVEPEDGSVYKIFELSDGYVFVLTLNSSQAGEPLTDEAMDAFNKFVESIEHLERDE